ncbi:signal peptidase I [Frigoribacterium sp. 2-23]|uniref:signal peptidase I n=1 Tax=Frigoribacterium sp. 2-23 TaxID=3415006 RepID=UPI003C6F8C26
MSTIDLRTPPATGSISLPAGSVGTASGSAGSGATATRASRARAASHWLRLVVGTLSRVVLYSALGLMLWAAAPSLIGWTPTTVMTGSMEPRIHPGDVVVAKTISAADLRVGQVLLFDDPDQAGHLRFHRLAAISADGTLTTRGDANAQNDSTPVAESAVHGVGYLRVPYVGLPVLWLQSHQYGHVIVTAGLLLLLVVGSRSDRYLLRPVDLERSTDRDGDEEARRGSGPGSTPSSRRVLRRRERRVRRLRTLGGAAALVAVASGLAITLVVSGGAGAGYAATAVNSNNAFGANSAYDCYTKAADSPYFAYGYNEASGTTAVDGGGAGRNGTITAGATRTTGTCTSNPYLQLSGTNSQVVTSAQITAPNVFTLETWFQTTSTTGGKLLGFGNSQSGTSSSYDRQLYVTTTGAVTFGVYNSGTKTITSATALNDGKWHHVMATMSADGMILYIDGVKSGATLNNTAGEPNTGWWRIGADNLSGWPNGGSNTFYTGNLDDTAVYTTALTATQVKAHYQAGR